MDEKFKEFTRKLHEILKPLGYRKEGVYFEKDEKITNRRFKEYDCQIRKRVDERDLGGVKEWWLRCTHKSRVSNLVFPLPVELVRS